MGTEIDGKSFSDMIKTAGFISAAVGTVADQALGSSMGLVSKGRKFGKVKEFEDSLSKLKAMKKYKGVGPSPVTPNGNNP